MSLNDVRADIVKSYGSIEHYTSSLLDRAKAGTELNIVDRVKAELTRIGESSLISGITSGSGDRVTWGKAPSQTSYIEVVRDDRKNIQQGNYPGYAVPWWIQFPEMAGWLNQPGQTVLTPALDDKGQPDITVPPPYDLGLGDISKYFKIGAIGLVALLLLSIISNLFRR